MITLTVTEEQYMRVADERRPLVLKRRTTTRPNPKHPKNDEIAKFGPLEITNPSGKYFRGCGVTEGAVRELRWKDEETGKTRGGLIVVADSVVNVEGDDWEVTFKAKAQPLGPGVMLAATPGTYTSDPTASCDPEAPVYETEDVRRQMADEAAARASKTKLEQMAEDTEGLAIDRRRVERIKRAIAEALEDIDGEAAA